MIRYHPLLRFFNSQSMACGWGMSRKERDAKQKVLEEVERLIGMGGC